MGFAAAQRAACCDDLLRAGPDAPTLCEGWTAADLVAHLWVRENDPVAAPGMVIGRLADLTQRRMDAALERWSFAGLVDLVRQGPPKGSAFALPDQLFLFVLFIVIERLIVGFRDDRFGGGGGSFIVLEETSLFGERSHGRYTWRRRRLSEVSENRKV